MLPGMVAARVIVAPLTEGGMVDGFAFYLVGFVLICLTKKPLLVLSNRLGSLPHRCHGVCHPVATLRRHL
jgi:hypothetical protein